MKSLDGEVVPLNHPVTITDEVEVRNEYVERTFFALREPI